jgi:hypothetical protein
MFGKKHSDETLKKNIGCSIGSRKTRRSWEAFSEDRSFG